MGCAITKHSPMQSRRKSSAPPINKAFARAGNARLIMSNKIPLMTADKEKPYCMWHPHLASVETYPELARRYPDMRYQVGRASVVGAYTKLYRGLDLLSDVSITEEAQDDVKVVGSKEIFNHTMCPPTRYIVINDYTCSVNLQAPPIEIGLNNNTAVLSSLSVRVEFWKDWTTTKPEIDTCHVNLVQEHVESIYPGYWQANAAVWELFIAVDDDLREAARQEECINLY